jgi:hypothetical protein
MQNNEIERLILRYLDRGFEDSNYMAAIVTALALPQICELICGLLKSDNYEAFRKTGLFLRDTILIGRHSDDCTAFREHYPDSIIVSTLEDLLFCGNHFTRSDVIYTLGKTCSYKSKYALSRAFELYRDSDPIILDRLVCEMRWLGVENIDRYIYSIVTSSSYLTRWAAVSIVPNLGNLSLQYVDILRRDECELIRIEAEYEYQRLLKSLQTPILSKSEQRQRAKALKKIKPLLSFEYVANRFRNYLWNEHSIDRMYEIVDLESFVELTRSEDLRSSK